MIGSLNNGDIQILKPKQKIRSIIEHVKRNHSFDSLIQLETDLED